ncbi:hypothetical protein LY76DRAFT_184994 [Colletotrichum caudatum]|nr:hypothetical protein LY76DRAFT_184994 [Colletotrichum caudatum]
MSANFVSRYRVATGPTLKSWPPNNGRHYYGTYLDYLSDETEQERYREARKGALLPVRGRQWSGIKPISQPLQLWTSGNETRSTSYLEQIPGRRVGGCLEGEPMLCCGWRSLQGFASVLMSDGGSVPLIDSSSSSIRVRNAQVLSVCQGSPATAGPAAVRWTLRQLVFGSHYTTTTNTNTTTRSAPLPPVATSPPLLLLHSLWVAYGSGRPAFFAGHVVLAAVSLWCAPKGSRLGVGDSTAARSQAASSWTLHPQQQARSAGGASGWPPAWLQTSALTY